MDKPSNRNHDTATWAAFRLWMAGGCKERTVVTPVQGTYLWSLMEREGCIVSGWPRGGQEVLGLFIDGGTGKHGGEVRGGWTFRQKRNGGGELEVWAERTAAVIDAQAAATDAWMAANGITNF